MLSYEMVLECEQRVLHSHQALLVDAASNQAFLLLLHKQGLLSGHQMHALISYGGIAGDKSARLADELMSNKQFTLGLLCLTIQQDYPALAEQLLQALSADTGAVEIEEELVHRHDTPPEAAAAAAGSAGGGGGGGGAGSAAGGGQSSAADKRSYGGASRRFTDNDRQLLSTVISTRSSMALETAREQVEYMTHEVKRLAERCDFVEAKLLEQTAKLGVFVRQNIELQGDDVTAATGGASSSRDGRPGATGGRRTNTGPGRRTDAGVIVRRVPLTEYHPDPMDDFSRFGGENFGALQGASGNGASERGSKPDTDSTNVGPGVINWCRDEDTENGFPGGSNAVFRVSAGAGGMRAGAGVGGVGVGLGMGMGSGRGGGIGTTKNTRRRASQERRDSRGGGPGGARGSGEMRAPPGAAPISTSDAQAHPRASLASITEENHIYLAEEFDAKLSFIFSSFLVSLREREYFWTRFEQVRKAVEARRVSWDVGRLLPKIQPGSLEFSRAAAEVAAAGGDTLDGIRSGTESGARQAAEDRVDDWEQLVNEREHGMRIIPSVTFQSEDGTDSMETGAKPKTREIDKSFAPRLQKSSTSLTPFGGSTTHGHPLGAFGSQSSPTLRVPGSVVTSTTAQKRISPIRLPTMTSSPGWKKNEPSSPGGNRGQGLANRK